LIPGIKGMKIAKVELIAKNAPEMKTSNLSQLPTLFLKPKTGNELV